MYTHGTHIIFAERVCNLVHEKCIVINKRSLSIPATYLHVSTHFTEKYRCNKILTTVLVDFYLLSFVRFKLKMI